MGPPLWGVVTGSALEAGQNDAAVAAFDREIQQIELWRATLASDGTREKDFRGLTIDDDLQRCRELGQTMAAGLAFDIF